jgi:hypothetical protein
MAVFKKGPKNPSGANGKPPNTAVPEGGYGSGGVPHKAQRTSAVKVKPSGGGKAPAYKPKSGYGTYGNPGASRGYSKSGSPSTCEQRAGNYASDGMAEPKSPIPSDQKTGRFNLPKGKFTY